MASKPKKSAPAAPAKKPARARPSKVKAAKIPERPKLSLEDRVAALEQHALSMGAHLPHAYPNEPDDPADAK